MFVESISVPRDEFDRWEERLRMLSDPPRALVASIVWDAGDDQVDGVNLWDSAEAVADFFTERVLPVVETEGEPGNKPRRHGEPVAVYVRQSS
jgi:hypothetical protein